MKKPVAVFTMVRNEPFFLRTWCNYYGSLFNHEDVFILDNSTIDGSVVQTRTIFPKMNYISIPSEETCDWRFQRDTVQNFQRMLLDHYQVVVFADADEFIVVDDNTGRSLYDYCKDFAEGKLYPKENYLRVTCWEPVQDIDSEEPFDTSKTVDLLNDRKTMWRQTFYDKTLITKIPLDYATGFHNLRTLREGPARHELTMLHMQKVDLGVYVSKNKARKKLPIKMWINGSEDLEQAQEELRSIPADPNLGGVHREIPARWRSLITYEPHAWPYVFVKALGDTHGVFKGAEPSEWFNVPRGFNLQTNLKTEQIVPGAQVSFKLQIIARTWPGHPGVVLQEHNVLVRGADPGAQEAAPGAPEGAPADSA